MHEVSLVRNVFKTLEEEFGQEEMQALKTVRMKIGELSNVVPQLMQNAFEAVKADHPQYEDVALEITWIPVQIYCKACDKKSDVVRYKFVCAHCGLPSSDVVAGNELMIHQVEFLEHDSEQTE